MRNLIFILIGFMGLTAFQFETDITLPAQACQKVELAPFNNLYRVDSTLYRSEQPSKTGMQALEQFGIKTVLNVRNICSDKNELKGTKLQGSKFRINTWTITYKEVIQAIKIIRDSPKPVLLHCKHGSDRTGCIVAVYQMIFHNTPKEKAIDEFKNGGYGYHEKAFPNILRLLEKIDVKQAKIDLGK
jgi:tyrosine-protein phosphatase SIW14